MAKYGKNKEGDHLKQLNLALLYGEQSMMPMYFRMLPCNISDVSLIPNLLKDVDFLNMEKLKLVLDRGFYSENNVNAMMKYQRKFLIGAKLNLKFIVSA